MIRDYSANYALRANDEVETAGIALQALKNAPIGSVVSAHLERIFRESLAASSFYCMLSMTGFEPRDPSE